MLGCVWNGRLPATFLDASDAACVRPTSTTSSDELLCSLASASSGGVSDSLVYVGHVPDGWVHKAGGVLAGAVK